MKRYYAFDKVRREWLVHGLYGYSTPEIRYAGSWDKASAIKGVLTRKLRDSWMFSREARPTPKLEDIVILEIDLAPLLDAALRAAGIDETVTKGGAA